MENSPIIISLGGSLIIPNGIDTDFLTEFKALITRHVDAGSRFALIIGGGKTARIYQEGARAVSDISSDDADWIGIAATHINAELLRSVFSPLTHASIVTNPTEPIHFTEKILVGAGWKPGWSTDYVSVLLAKNLGAKKLINLSNIDYVYDADPRTNPNAKKIEDISWGAFRKIIPEKWDPGLNAPFDPIAAKEAESLGLEVSVMNGKNLENIDAYLSGKPYLGTKIHS